MFFNPVKTFWLKEEISIADELLSLAPKLTEEFLAYHTDFETEFTKAPLVEYVPSKNGSLKVELLKVICPSHQYNNVGVINNTNYLNKEIQQRYPTATSLIEKLGDKCSIAGYNILEPYGVVSRHSDVYNRDNKFLPIHIPLIIPDGDIFFEVNGIEIDWQDLFGFDNQLNHSAYNYTKKRRLIFMIDICRETFGIENGQPFDPNSSLKQISDLYDDDKLLRIAQNISSKQQQKVEPFIRGILPKFYHTKQLNRKGQDS